MSVFAIILFATLSFVEQGESHTNTRVIKSTCTESYQQIRMHDCPAATFIVTCPNSTCETRSEPTHVLVQSTAYNYQHDHESCENASMHGTNDLVRDWNVLNNFLTVVHETRKHRNYHLADVTFNDDYFLTKFLVYGNNITEKAQPWFRAKIRGVLTVASLDVLAGMLAYLIFIGGMVH
jgi:hypothetical protein